ncbi:EAL domain-containing protein [Oceanimonas sp. CHS3-5]|uniref:EAL domain-containing protein n=1 Tax=Oceanimonas sp. CHS3-5 TaxID=3068186 RepID=UPI00273CF928|nr:EAL domain-containing protein [Oceanimonas sp. CHS3-5]MDP5293769.1 EAL domain-containing protein [Oceanimonas sp. CHS3-5]
MRRLFIPLPGTEHQGAGHVFKRAGILLLLLCMLLFGIGAAHSLLNIRQHNTLLEQRNYEVPWSMMQLKLEMSRFLDAVRLLHAGAIDHDELMLRYDILWSRTPVLLSNQLKDTLSDRPDLWQLIQQIENRVRAMEPMVKAIRPGSPDYQLLLAELSPYTEPLARTMTATMHSNVLFYAEYDQAYRELGRELYISILGLALSGVLLLLLLGSELLGYRRRLLRDPLTGLPNRFALQHRLQQQVNRQQPFSLTLLALKDYSRCYQQFGFEVADALQQAFARRLEACLLPEEGIALLGRESLAVVANGVLELSDVRVQLSRIRQALSAPESIAQHDFHLTPEIGVVLYPADADNVVDLLARGELALELCRHEQLPYVIFEPSMLKEIERRQQLAADLPAALESDSLTLRFYPLATPSGQCAGLRLSLQWRHPRYGDIGDSELVRVTEQYQLSERLLLWTLSRVGELLPGWRRVQPTLFVSLALSPSVFRFSLGGQLETLLAGYGLEGNALTLEVGEPTVMEAPHQAQSILAELRRPGVRIMLAEFGTGCSRWGPLARLPLDWLQLDASCCSGIEQSEEARSQLATLFGLARLLGVPPVCCGVSSAAERGVIVALGGEPLLQGPFVSPSLAAMEVKTWLESLAPARLTDFDVSQGA